MRSFGATASAQRSYGRSAELAVTVQAVGGREGEHIAWFRSEPMEATFSVLFHDNLVGAIALHEFAEMIRRRYKVDHVRLEVSDQQLVFRSQALLDVLASTGRRL